MAVLAGLGLLLAALTLAGQSVILDYIMGTLILVEGQYFKGDTISVGESRATVEEVGLRRTVLRDTQGIVHSVSNGTIRVSSNLTRIFAVAMVDIEGVRNRDVEAVIAIMDQVGREMSADPAWAGLIVEAPSYRSTPAFTDLRRDPPDVHQGPHRALDGARRAATPDGARVHECRHPAQSPDGRQLRAATLG